MKREYLVKFISNSTNESRYYAKIYKTNNFLKKSDIVHLGSTKSEAIVNLNLMGYKPINIMNIFRDPNTHMIYSYDCDIKKI